ncbi:CHAD domain-containing protein [Labilibacter sediminis]|nr:CHAD domain-containing protein [Labilibacter sediminis]
MKLEDYVGNQISQFNKNLKIAVDKADVDAIHDLRVSLKKLFVLHKVVKQHFPHSVKQYSSSYKLVRTFFKKTGGIRDYQIADSLATQWLNNTEQTIFYQYSEEKIIDALNQLVQHYNSVDVNNVEQSFKDSYKQISDKYLFELRDYLLSYIEGNAQRINKILLSEDSNYHKVRSLIKEQYYVQVQLRQIIGLSINPKILEKKNRQGKLLGQWHDLQMFKKLLAKADIDLRVEVSTNLQKKEALLLSEAGML